MRSMSQCFNIVHLAVGFTAGQLPVLNGQTTCALWVSVYTKWPAKAAVDAVDGSSTGTRVPWMWALLRLPRFRGATHANGQDNWFRYRQISFPGSRR